MARACARVKVTMYHNIVAPHRVPLFEELSKNIDLTVYFGKKGHNYRKWNVKKNPDFQYEVLKNVGTLPMLFVVNPLLPLKLLKKRYDAYIGADANLLGTQITFIISKLLKKPFILWIGERDYSKENKIPFPKSIYFKSIKAISYIIAKNADACIAYGRETARKLSRIGVHQDKIHIGINTIPLEPIRTRYENAEPLALRKKLGIPNETRVILSLSYLEERKGIQHLLDAYKKLKEETNNIALVIAGSGSYEKQLKNLAQNMIDVYFTGHVSDEEKPTYYKMASIFVLPSLRDPWGLTVNEAMICEKPIIVTYDAGAWELIKGNGTVIPSGNSHSLYLALKKLLYEEHLEKLGCQSWQIIQNITIPKIAETFMEVIQNVA